MASGTERRARRSRAHWQTLIERGERSPLGIGAFCRAEGVSTASFYNWRKRLRESAPNDGSATAGAPAPTFLDLGALGAADGGAGCWDIELALGDDVVLRLRRA
jgi:hypothetical protein